MVTWVDLVFICFCALCGALGGFGIWACIGGVAGPARLVRAQARGEGSDPVAAAPPAPAPALPSPVPALDTNEALAEILEFMREMKAWRGPAEDRLLNEVRAAVSAEDPDVRLRLDRIAAALGVSVVPGVDADLTAGPDDPDAQFAGSDAEDTEDDVSEQAGITPGVWDEDEDPDGDDLSGDPEAEASFPADEATEIPDAAVEAEDDKVPEPGAAIGDDWVEDGAEYGEGQVPEDDDTDPPPQPPPGAGEDGRIVRQFSVP